ncbi:unnamed protein product, partial [Prorocentrum cordatum]
LDALTVLPRSAVGGACCGRQRASLRGRRMTSSAASSARRRACPAKRARRLVALLLAAVATGLAAPAFVASGRRSPMSGGRRPSSSRGAMSPGPAVTERPMGLNGHGGGLGDSGGLNGGRNDGGGDGDLPDMSPEDFARLRLKRGHNFYALNNEADLDMLLRQSAQAPACWAEESGLWALAAC